MKKMIFPMILGLFLLSAGKNLFAASYSEVREVSPYLKEISYTDYDIRIMNEIAEKVLASASQQSADAEKRESKCAAGCSVAVSGVIFGRNYDFPISNADQCVIHVSAREGRHASLGVASFSTMQMKQAGADYLKPEQEMDLLPYYTLDGVNDAGLAVAINIVPHDHGYTTGTNPGGPRVAHVALVRVLLDQCASVKEAIALVRKIDYFSIPALEAHFLVADASGATCVIEMVDNKVLCLENQRIMTNFYLYDFLEKGVHTPHAEGIERYRTLKNGLGGVKSVSDMAKLLGLIRFSLAAKPGNEQNWWSDFNDYPNPFLKEFPQSPEVFFHQDDKVFSQAKEARLQLIAIERKTLYDALDVWHKTGKIPPDVWAWMTIHSSVYDCAAKTLELRLLEMDDKTYRFELK